LFEVAWEVCNQVGGIHTVIKSKVPSILEHWQKDKYLLIGPYFEHQAAAAFEPIHDAGDDVFKAVQDLNQSGFKAYYGTWLIEGRPRIVLLDFTSSYDYLGDLKYLYWEHHGISFPEGDSLLEQVLLFGHQVHQFVKLFSEVYKKQHKVITHFHEWMAGIPIPEMRRENVKSSIVFTTHATMLGRYLAMNDGNFYDNLPQYNWEKEAVNYNIEAQVKIERAAAHGCHIFSTVSEITGVECKHLLGREPDIYLPNGLNINRYEALHEFQNLHLQYKQKINEFVMSHFFQSYSFDLDKTIYFFTSGRYEYVNKGYDLTLEALARLNYKLKKENVDVNIVMFIITKNPVIGFNPEVLEFKAELEEIQRNCEQLNNELSNNLFKYLTTQEGSFNLPNLNQLIHDYTILRLRRNIQAWKSHKLPTVITHELQDEGKDEIMNFLKSSNLLNLKEDKVKIVYHPDFVSTSNPLFRMEYSQLIRGCHMGIFPSYYEPWGYTPLECIASGIPAITSNLSGFGSYVETHITDPERVGIYVLNRKNKTYHDTAEKLASILFNFIKKNRRERIEQRNKVESSSVQFDWEKLCIYYLRAYGKVVRATK
jgi:glycogen(starch) synthase